jgi:hypothetical protein
MSTVELTTLLPPESFLLAYALPLFTLSLILNFAGAFLTLDRTRSFSPTADAFPVTKTSRINLIRPFFHGGVGGIIAGYAFGLHFSTFLSLLIPSLSSSKSLASGSFLAVWILSSLFAAIIAGRWRYAALIAAGISGGSTLALSLSVIIHPSLITRVIVVAVFFPILTVLVLLPLPRFQYSFIRIAMSSTGSFGLVLSIALMANIPAWSNVWERLWVSDNIGWGTPKEKGLSTSFCLFLCGGIACNWLLKRHFGENPDQKWDNYLAGYAANLPNVADRAGSFQPLSSMWSKIFSHSHTIPVLAPPYCDPQNDPLTSEKTALKSLPGTFEKTPEFLRRAKKRSSGSRKNRGIVKFRPLDVDNLGSDSDSDSDFDDTKPRTPLGSPMTVHLRPWLPPRPPLSSRSTGSTTVLEDDSSEAQIEKIENPDVIEKEKAKLFTMRKSMYNVGKAEVPEYSDHEEDVTAEVQISRDNPAWSPPFLHRHRNSQSEQSSKGSNSSKSTRTPPPGAVPVTPSLINALDRIVVAQEQAYGVSVHDRLPEQRNLVGPRWDLFWKDVNDKARQDSK